MRDRATRLARENERLKQALTAAEETARLERQRARIAQEASRLAWRIAATQR